MSIMLWVLLRAERVAISLHGTLVLFTSHPQDRLVVNLYIPHNQRTPLHAEEALGPISIPRGSSANHAALMSKSKYWLAWNRDNEFKWSDMSSC
jgi:hypothetical protein